MIHITEEKLIAHISKEFRKEENDIKNVWKLHPVYRNGALEGIRLAEIIVKQQIIKG